MASQTAVDWVEEQLATLIPLVGGMTTLEYLNKRKSIIEQAKQMEKEQIIHAWREGDNDSMYYPKELDQQAEQYYNETYNK